MTQDKLTHTVPLRIAEMETLKQLLVEVSYISTDDCLALPEDYFEPRAKPVIERLSEAIEAAKLKEQQYEQAIKLERGEA
ncbi:hypothetical protein C8255_19780 [filamentous cyanobacterium CCP3]|nr:hypothetical protein C8255_19780 [filamentous cyanobacterium CCP3]